MDLYIFQAINGLSHHYWLVDYIAIFTAEYFGYFLVVACLFLIFKEKKMADKIYFFSLVSLSLILSRGIITETIKFFSQRERPFSALDIMPLIEKSDAYMSFPSGHAAFYFALAFAIFLYYRKLEKNSVMKESFIMLNFKTILWFFGAALLISLSRIFAGIHWTSDILVGALIGVGSAFIIKKLLDMEWAKK